MKKKPWLVAVLAVTILAAAALGFFWPFGDEPEVLQFPATVEIQEVRLGSKIGGRVKEVLVLEGQTVKPGDALVVFDVPELEAQRDQYSARVEAARAERDKAVSGPREEEKKAARAAAAAAKARWERLTFGWREEEKEQAKQDLASADADLKRAEEDLTRISKLYQQRSASRAEYDQAIAARDIARGRANAARARHTMIAVTGSRKEDIAEAHAEWEKAKAKEEELYTGSRKEDIELAKAQLAEAEAKLREIEENLKEREVRVPKALGAAVVQVLAVRPGDLVPPGQPVVRVLRTEDQWVRFYVPETELGKIRLKQRVDITIDAYSRKRFTGTVDSISSVAEFIPRNVQTRDERRHQVFGVKAKVSNDQGLFHAGMAAEVFVPVGR